jgi:segregation and condensation protein A
MAFEICIETFTGSLVDFIRLLRRAGEITRFQLHLIMLSYLDYAEDAGVSIDSLCDDVALWAEVMRLKARQLLPPDEVPAEEEADITEVEDEAESLITKKQFYEQLNQWVSVFSQMADESGRAFPRAEPEVLGTGARLELPPLEALTQAFARVLLDAIPDTPATMDMPEISVKEMILRVHALVTASSTGLTFSEIFSRRPTRVEVVIAFLAVLELIRSGRIMARQNSTEEEIRLFGDTRHGTEH